MDTLLHEADMAEQEQSPKSSDHSWLFPILVGGLITWLAWLSVLMINQSNTLLVVTTQHYSSN